MASTYKAYLGEGLGPLEWIKQFHIPHPGRVIGRAVLHLTMPAVLEWVLGGNNGHLARARPSACRVEDRLKVRGRDRGTGQERGGMGARRGLDSAGGSYQGMELVSVTRTARRVDKWLCIDSKMEILARVFTCGLQLYVCTLAWLAATVFVMAPIMAEPSDDPPTHTLPAKASIWQSDCARGCMMLSLSGVLGNMHLYVRRVRVFRSCGVGCCCCVVQVFNEDEFQTFMRNDDEIFRSAHARWMLLSERDPTCTTADATSSTEAKGVYINSEQPLSIGSAPASVASNGNGNGKAAATASAEVPDLFVSGPSVAAEHARVWQDAQGDCWVQDLPSSSGTWINGKLINKGDKARLLPQVRRGLKGETRCVRLPDTALVADVWVVYM